ncbi:hypothetical protein BO94DRAFT_547406 [Aspergillus sclerotioniger CBS 115572]|uniref:Uncharacterized protein n=1 Tax=Aspergillus sclerotioniger CBS 115572 TaxID=1450535 RepID=A0A317WDB7_9EURO|nr:hypothetical protein BO94DRAFT_547406 [Aspergillus sclerotioniger CBS 115572]PWY83751.1 hypothetical protein BO94DRAFT_547406 [Aspergillus sclerotioniger CBS 115572]
MPAIFKKIKNGLKSLFKKKKPAQENPEGAAAEETPATDKPAEEAQPEGHGVSDAPPTLEVTETPAGAANPATEAHAESAAPVTASEPAAKPTETAGDAADKETK